MPWQLDREVALQLGYYVKQLEISPNTGRARLCLVAPDGEVYHPANPYPESEDHVWQELAPHFSSDEATAMTLVPESTLDTGFMLRRMQDGWLATITDLSPAGTKNLYEGIGTTVPEAICNAWLNWQRGLPAT